jgi:pSer/pThr/pTyr-binding forkhead associated (FHA) protein
MPSLIIESGGKKAKYGISVDVVTMGRGDGNTIRLQDVRSSRRHCQIVKTDKGYVLQDLQSGNGTHIDGERISEVLLTPGLTFSIGSTNITFDGSSDAPSSAPSPDSLGGAVSATEPTIRMSPSEVRVATQPTVKVSKPAGQKKAPSARVATPKKPASARVATPKKATGKTAKAKAGSQTSARPAKGASGRTARAASASAKPSGKTARGKAGASGRTARAGAAGAAGAAGSSRSGRTARSGSMSAQMSQRMRSQEKGKNSAILIGGIIAAVALFVVLGMTLGSKNTEVGSSNSAAAARFEEARSLYKAYQDGKGGSPEEQIAGRNALFQAVQIYEEIMNNEAWAYAEEGVMAKQQYRNFEGFYKAEKEARQVVPDLKKRYDECSVDQSPVLLDEVRSYQRKFSVTTYYKEMDVLIEKLERMKTMASSGIRIEYDDMAQSEKTQLKTQNYSAAIADWEDFLGKVKTNAEYTRKVQTRIDGLQRKAKEWAAQIVERAKSTSDIAKAKASLEDAASKLSGTDGNGIVQAELKSNRYSE